MSLRGRGDEYLHRVAHRRGHAVELAPLQADQCLRELGSQRRRASEGALLQAGSAKQDADLVEIGFAHHLAGAQDAFVLLAVDRPVEDERAAFRIDLEHRGNADIGLALDLHPYQLLFFADLAQQRDDLLARAYFVITPVIRVRIMYCLHLVPPVLQVSR